jgi:hypothetical protein
MLRHVMPKNKDNADDAMRLILVYEQPAWVDEACACMRVLVYARACVCSCMCAGVPSASSRGRKASPAL